MKMFQCEAAAPVVVLAWLLLPVLTVGLPLSTARAEGHHLSLRQSPLPAGDERLLRKVEQEVKELKAPPSSQPTSPPQQGSAATCRFMGNIVSAKLSGRCCTNVKVISQKRLLQYGLTQQCEPSWHCGVDGKTPTAAFEAQSVREMCGEPGCMPAVVGAMRSNWMTAKGADEMGGICSSLASLGQNSSAETIAGLLHDGGEREEKDLEELECKEEVCVDKGRRDELCESKNETEMCYKWCCKNREQLGCFAGEATADVRGRGSVPMAELRTGDEVLVESRGQLVYEPILSFLHIFRPAYGAVSHFMTVVHSHGEFQATDTHIVFVATDGVGHRGVSRLVGRLTPGDKLIVTDPGNSGRVTPSTVLAVRRSTSQLGMYAPLTASGTIVVDGVVASNYASPSAEKDLTHHAAHAFMLPVRLYHQLGLGTLLRPLWQRVCGGPGHWLCQGDHLDISHRSARPLGNLDQLHPYITIFYRGLKLDVLV